MPANVLWPTTHQQQHSLDWGLPDRMQLLWGEPDETQQLRSVLVIGAHVNHSRLTERLSITFWIVLVMNVRHKARKKDSLKQTNRTEEWLLERPLVYPLDIQHSYFVATVVRNLKKKKNRICVKMGLIQGKRNAILDINIRIEVRRFRWQGSSFIFLIKR